MVQMSIESFLVRAIRELLSKVMPERKFIDRHIINNVRIRVRQRKRKVVNANIVTHPKHLDTSFIEIFKDTSNNYTECMYTFIILCRY